MSGIELGKQLSAAGSQAAIIFMTGSENDMIHRQAMTFGCVAYLKKPFLADDLLSSIVMLTIKRPKCPASVV
jgi:FixJ family two-component response regulator